MVRAHVWEWRITCSLRRLRDSYLSYSLAYSLLNSTIVIEALSLYSIWAITHGQHFCIMADGMQSYRAVMMWQSRWLVNRREAGRKGWEEKTGKR
jgi:hypothetical protein